jgi:CRP/FNR family transcriptional regulator, cyclic AMP receptor protein
MGSDDKPDDILAFYRPDILPLAPPPAPDVVARAVSPEARIEHLRRVSLFSECTDEELRRIADISRVVEAPVGTVVTQMGTPGDSFFFLIDGRVSVQTPVGPGEPMTPGDFFGEMSLLDGEPRSATVTAITDLRMLVVDRTHFWRLLNETPDLVRRILVVLSGRIRRLERAATATLHRINLT